MPSVSQLKGRIRSVNSTKQITGAMELVSASKMRRAADASLATHEYHAHATELIERLMADGIADGHPLFVHRPMRSRLLVVITSDTGLAGAYNSNVLKRYVASLKMDKERGVRTLTIAVGRKIANFAARLDEAEVIGVYKGISGALTPSDYRAIVDTAVEKYARAEIDAVDIIYTKYCSSLSQEARLWHLLPAGHTPGKEDDFDARSAIFEPSRAEVFNVVVERIIEIQVVQAILDSVASEHSMRMMAMKNATDNATELSDDLTLEMNKARQAAITQEISEISNGAEAVK
ncbi:MAG: ATP synthase F1 subunit gamma [Candidatus Nomurabacteria bacterium]|jgi:F-type H+-transporting ATPase subunit gamma|nr:ATP synthase F1 subunit gamma [Candidatus Nomurabacteria bacterium]